MVHLKGFTSASDESYAAIRGEAPATTPYLDCHTYYSLRASG